MKAFWSGTDDANENVAQFYGVWGKVTDENPDFLFRWVCGDSKVNIDASLLFDIPQVEIVTKTRVVFPEGIMEPVEKTEVLLSDFNGPWPEVAYPDDWYGQHKKKTYTPSKTQTTYGGRGTSSKKTTGQNQNRSLYGSSYYDYLDEDVWDVGDQISYGFDDDSVSYLDDDDIDQYDGEFDVPDYLDTPIYEKTKKKQTGELKITAFPSNQLTAEEEENVKNNVDLIVDALDNHGYEDHVVELLKK